MNQEKKQLAEAGMLIRKHVEQVFEAFINPEITVTSTIITYRNLSIPIASIIAILIAFLSPILSNVAYLLILVIMLIVPLLVKRT